MIDLVGGLGFIWLWHKWTRVSTEMAPVIGGNETISHS